MILLITNSVVRHLVPIFIRNDLTAYVKANQYRCDRTGIQAHRSHIVGDLLKNMKKDTQSGS